jgi:predicted permease
MRTLREWLVRAMNWIRPRRHDADLEDELRAHLALAAEAADRGRQPSADAARAAAIRAGGMPGALEAMRDQRGLPALEQGWRDVRYAVRALRRRPGFSAVVLLTLGVGLGANVAIFAVVNGVLIKPLAYPESERLVGVWHVAPGAPGLASVSGDLRLSASMYFTYSEQNTTFDALGVWYAVSAAVTGASEPEEVRAVVVSDGTLQALGVPPLAGRALAAADQDLKAPEAVLLGYRYWQRRFAGSTNVIGRSLTLDARPREIVGVMPQGFTVVQDEADVIVPIRFDRSRTTLPGFGFQAVARLKPGVTLDDANADIARMVPLWMRSWPAAAGVNPLVYESWQISPRLRPLKRDVVGPVERPLWLLLGTIGIVLAIACANVANLLIVRAEGRRQELAIRAALGAGRRRVIRALLAESLVLAVAGGALGVALAYLALHWLLAIGPSRLPRTGAIAIDPAVLMYAVAISVLCGLACGFVAALRATGSNLPDALRAGGRSATDGRERHRTRSGLVVGQVALAVVWLVGAGLMMRTFQAMRVVEPGFTEPARLQTVRISVAGALIADADRVAHLQQDIVERIHETPGVQTVAFASSLPLDGTPPDWDCVFAEGRTYAAEEVPPFRLFKKVSPGFFETMGTALRAGREFSWIDLYEHRRAVVVSENFARELWGSAQAAIGKRIRTLDSAPWQEVIGVAADVHENGVHQPAPATVYWPSLGESAYRAGSFVVARSVTFVIRTDRSATEDFLAGVRRDVWSLNASVPITGQQTMAEIYARSMERTSFTLVLLALAAAMGLFLGVVGLYGVIAYDVSRRTREIGIRLALGAEPRLVRRLFVRHGLVLAVMGVALGAIGAVALTRLMSSLVFGVTVRDPATYALVAGGLAATTAFASYLAARRATSVDPLTALKTE